MARTKQTARHSTGVTAPRAQLMKRARHVLATKCARRTGLSYSRVAYGRTGASASGSDSDSEGVDSGLREIQYDIDYDRAFYAHFFQMKPVKEDLRATYSLARTRKRGVWKSK